MLSDPEVSPLIIETTNAYSEALKKGIEKRDIPADMLRMLQDNTFIFSGFKTHAELSEISALLMDNGKLKPFERFKQDVKDIDRDYNTNYLRAEYNFAVSSSRSAAMWSDLSKDSDKYYLQYRTAKDERVREEHATLDEITLPANDPFWKDYFPPNGWNCRCTVVKVRRSKYTESNSKEAIKKGINATTKINKNGQNKAAIFRFNPGIEQKVFPPRHPYYKVPKEEKKAIETSLDAIDNPHPALSNLKGEEPSVAKINKAFKEINDSLPENNKWFKLNYDLKLKVTNKSDINGETDLYGTIWLKPDRLKNVKHALSKIANQKSDTLTYSEADAMATFWHEITHNKHKGSPYSGHGFETDLMELANEWVARNSLDEFYSTLGCNKTPFNNFKFSRKESGYNDMVTNLDYVIKKLNLNKDVALSHVKDYLINGKYEYVYEGLKDGLIAAGINGTVEKPIDFNMDYLLRVIAYTKDGKKHMPNIKRTFDSPGLTKEQLIDQYLSETKITPLEKK